MWVYEMHRQVGTVIQFWIEKQQCIIGLPKQICAKSVDNHKINSEEIKWLWKTN